MPKREDVQPVKEAPAKVAAKKAAPVKKAETKEPKKPSLLIEFSKFLSFLGAEFENKVQKTHETSVKEDNETIDILFAVFSENGKSDTAPDEETNVSTIKDILFLYHTKNWELVYKKDDSPILAVLPPDGKTTKQHVLSFQFD